MSQGDWELLTEQQRQDVDALRNRIGQCLITESEAFYKAHPELRLTWSFMLDALIRELHPVVTVDL